MSPWWSAAVRRRLDVHGGELPHWWERAPSARVRAAPLACLQSAAKTYGFELEEPLGFGHQGFVWSSTSGRAVKVTGDLSEVETAIWFMSEPRLEGVRLVPEIFVAGKLPCWPSCGLIQREDLADLEPTLKVKLLQGGATERQAAAALASLEGIIHALMQRGLPPDQLPERLAAGGREHWARTRRLVRILDKKPRGMDLTDEDLAEEAEAGRAARRDLSILINLNTYFYGPRIAPYPLLVRIFQQVAHDLHRIYNEGLYLEDLVLDNFGIRQDLSVAVRDFGYSTKVPPGLGTIGRIGR